MKFDFKSPSKQRRQAVFNHLVFGMGKHRACVKAGLSLNMKDNIFDHYRVQKYKEQWKQMESELPDDKQELLAYYRSIMNMPSNQSTIVLRTKKYLPLKQQLNSSLEPQEHAPRMVISGEEEKEVVIVSTADRLNAAKEISVLLGLREEKSRVTAEDSLIKALSERRAQLAVEDDE